MTEYNTLLSKSSNYNIIDYSIPNTQLNTQLDNENQSTTNDYTSNRVEFINPDFNMGIEFATQEKLLWIHIKSIAIEKQKNFIRPSQPTIEAKAGATEYNFKFLAQQELIETLSHEWSPFESISQSIQQMYGSTMITSMNVLGALKQAYGDNVELYKAMIGAISEGRLEFKDVKETISETVHDLLAGENVQAWRVDTPLVYKNTERRTYEFVFNLISLKGDPENEVVEPVKMLEKLSCPSKPEDLAQGYNPLVIPPYVFAVYTRPALEGSINLINIPFAALRTVNPTWRGPFVNGQPMRCELRLTFQEIEPVYSSSVLTNTVVEVLTLNP